MFISYTTTNLVTLRNKKKSNSITRNGINLYPCLRMFSLATYLCIPCSSCLQDDVCKIHGMHKVDAIVSVHLQRRPRWTGVCLKLNTDFVVLSPHTVRCLRETRTKHPLSLPQQLQKHMAQYVYHRLVKSPSTVCLYIFHTRRFRRLMSRPNFRACDRHGLGSQP